MPKQGKEIAMDTAVLELLGIPAKLGEEVELTVQVPEQIEFEIDLTELARRGKEIVWKRI